MRFGLLIEVKLFWGYCVEFRPTPLSRLCLKKEVHFESNHFILPDSYPSEEFTDPVSIFC